MRAETRVAFMAVGFFSPYLGSAVETRWFWTAAQPAESGSAGHTVSRTDGARDRKSVSESVSSSSDHIKLYNTFTFSILRKSSSIFVPSAPISLSLSSCGRNNSLHQSSDISPPVNQDGGKQLVSEAYRR